MVLQLGQVCALDVQADNVDLDAQEGDLADAEAEQLVLGLAAEALRTDGGGVGQADGAWEVGDVGCAGLNELDCVGVGGLWIL